MLPGATITVTGTALHRENATTVSASDGTYRVPLLPPGVYQLTVELAGFKPITRENIDVALNQQTTVDLALGVASVSEAVSVTGSAPIVETTRSDVTNRVTNRTIDALPLNGRNFTDLVALVPGARPVPEGQQGTNVSIFGERGASTSFLVDGAENNDPLERGAALRYTQDSIQEFEVITTGYEAEFGRAQGGVVNVITRSGTNLFDGRAFWFRRDDSMDASNVPKAGCAEALARRSGARPWAARSSATGRSSSAPSRAGRNARRQHRPRGRSRRSSRPGSPRPGGTEDFGLAPETDRPHRPRQARLEPVNPVNRLTL